MPRPRTKPAPVQARKAGSEKFLVTDLNASSRSGPRVHEMPEKQRFPNGKTETVIERFTFNPGEATEMPRDMALRFAKADPSFEVRTPDGNKIKPVDALTESGDKIALEPGQVIAAIEDLTDEALIERAKKLPGAEDMPANPKRDDLIAFVLAGGDDEYDEDLGDFERVPEPVATKARAEIDDPMQAAINDGDEIDV
jgi:hypothetical protein